MAEKVEWVNKIRSVMQPSKGAPSKGTSTESGLPIRQSLSDGSLVSSNLCSIFMILILQHVMKLIIFFVRAIESHFVGLTCTQTHFGSFWSILEHVVMNTKACELA